MQDQTTFSPYQRDKDRSNHLLAVVETVNMTKLCETTEINR
jgi:hypothetical protein